jgi:hypothetical protein
MQANTDCPACKAPVLRDDDRVDSFHRDCYDRWIASLYAEKSGRLVKTRRAIAAAAA